MDGLTPDELNDLCAIPPDTYSDLAMEVCKRLGPMPLPDLDREVLKLWYGRQPPEEKGPRCEQCSW